MPQQRPTIAEFDLKWLSSESNLWTDLEGKRHQIQIASYRREAFARTPFCVRCGTKGQSLVLVLTVSNGNSKSIEFIDRWGARLTIDHIYPKCRGGKNSLENLQVLCSSCNRLKGSRSQQVFVNEDQLNGYVWKSPPTK